MNRRSFLGGVTAATVAAGFLGLPTIAEAKEIGPENPVQRREDEWGRRNGDAAAEKLLPPKHPTNGDEERYFNKIGNFSKGLPHDALGGVELPAYTGLITALTSGLASDLEAIQLGGTLKLSNPQSSYAYCLEGSDSHVGVTAPPPTYAGNEQGSEMAENYWMALARDVAFANYDTDSDHCGGGLGPEHFSRLPGAAAGYSRQYFSRLYSRRFDRAVRLAIPGAAHSLRSHHRAAADHRPTWRATII